jgi:hypothetical protein
MDFTDRKNHPSDYLNIESLLTRIRELETTIDNLEDELNEARIASQYNKEQPLRDMLLDIKSSCVSTLQQDSDTSLNRYMEPVDFKQCIINLKTYIENTCKDYNIYL